MLKTFTKSVLVVSMASVLFTGCNQPQTAPVAATDQFACKQDGVLAPEWTCDPYIEGAIVSLGIAQKNAGNDKAFQRTEAIAAARDALVRQVKVKVSTLLKSYKASTGSGADATFDKSSSTVSKQLASQTLSGSRQVGRSWSNPKTGEFFIMVGMEKAPIKEAMEKAITTSFKNDKALYQEFKAAKASGDLDKALSQN